ncbi:MAG TPA: twin-arginine translocase subunit TatC [Steroidobacteraceae bacterium]|nr:twin-arginine translocase subunit TatC [Steroidobacteraceae bacterium]
MASPEPERENLAEGTLISHLLELRTRLLRALMVVIIVSIPCMIYANDLFTFISKPLLRVLPKGATMISTSVIAPLMTPFKLAFYIALVFSMPYVLYQAWAFIAPGLYRHEKRFALPLLISSVILFYAGVAFAYFVVFPVMFAFFTATTPPGVQMMTDMTQYLDFVLVLFLAFGLAFEIPVAIVLLVWTGIVKIETLKRNRGYVLIAVFIQAAVIVPPDVVSQTAMALPMYALYEVGIVMARILAKNKLEERAREEREREAGTA